jgi:hypothetical protein
MKNKEIERGLTNSSREIVKQLQIATSCIKKGIASTVSCMTLCLKATRKNILIYVGVTESQPMWSKT